MPSLKSRVAGRLAWFLPIGYDASTRRAAIMSALTGTFTGTLSGTFTPAAPGPTPTPTPAPTPMPTDPAFYTTPAVIGVGVRQVNVVPGAAPTLADALANAQPGDDIVLAAGVHRPGRGVTLSRSGVAANWISIRGLPGTIVDLEGKGEFLLAGSYVALEGVEVIHGAGNSVHVSPAAGVAQSHVIVRRCKIHALLSGPGAAIKANRSGARDCTDLYLESNDVSEAVGGNAVIDGVGCSRVVLRGNHVHDNAPGGHGLFFKGGSTQVLVERNVVRRIRGAPAIQLGGDTEFPYFDPAHREAEAFDFVVRGNFVTDADDSIFEFRGVRGARVYDNHVLAATGFSIFRFAFGRSGLGTPDAHNFGTPSGNDAVTVAGNLVIATGATPPTYAQNDGSPGTFHFDAQAWAGLLRNAPTTQRAGLPSFPIPSDVVISSSPW